MEITLTWKDKVIRKIQISQLELEQFNDGIVDFWYDDWNDIAFIAPRFNPRKRIRIV